MQDGPCHSASGNEHVSWIFFFFFAFLVQATVEANRDFLNLGFSLSTLTPFGSSWSLPLLTQRLNMISK